jgi:hypothetical protein
MRVRNINFGLTLVAEDDEEESAADVAALANPLNFGGARGAFVIRARVEVEAAR